MKLTSRQFWERHWQDAELETDAGCELHDDIAPLLPKEPGLSFMEIGCAPGRILADFCSRYGYTAHGLDYACEPGLIEAVLKRRGATIGKIWKEDFFTWEPKERFDMVASFGFVEHFDDANEVIDRHFGLAKPGGTVVVAMPNFAGGQRVLHWLFDRKNLRGHNTRIMNMPFLKEVARRNDAEIAEARFAGGHFDFWIDKASPLMAQRVVWRVVPPLRALANRLGPQGPAGTNPYFSPYLFAVYRAGK